MGLDIYLVKYQTPPTDDQDDDIDDQDDDIEKEYIELPSVMYPDHLNKIGYLRSSYNSNGFNSVIGAMLNVDGFYHLFGRDRNDDYVWQPDWEATQKRAENLLELFDKVVEQDKGGLKAIWYGPNRFMSESDIRDICSSDADAINVTRQQINQGGKGSYSNRNGTFYLDEPLEVIAMVPGYQWDQVGVYAVFRVGKESLAWYRDTIAIVAEFADYVIRHPERDKLYLHWSS